MKKFIAIALMLAMCLGLFAACGENNTPTEPVETKNPLASAAAYLKTMYKDKAGKVLRDFELVSVVTIDGTKYDIEWTTDAAEENVKIVAGENGKVTIDINEKPAEQVDFTLTATVKDSAGKSEQTSLKFYVPPVKEVEIVDDKIVILNPDSGKYVSGTDYLYTSSSGSQKHELELVDDKASALQMTARKNDDGTVTFVTNDGKFLMADGTNVQIVAEEGEHTKFVLEATEGGQFIKCANATYNDKPQYLEIYSGYLTVYGMNESKAAIYTFQLESVGGSSQAAILEAAYALGEDESLSGGPFTLTGVISSIDTEWSDEYKNITVTIICDGDKDHPMKCFRLQGDGAKDLAVGDTITVTGEIKNYKGTIEFDAKCNLDKVTKAEGGEVEEPEASNVTIITGFTVPMANGNKVVIVAASFNKAFSSLPAKEGSYYQKGVDITANNGTLAGYADTEVWVVTANDDGTYTFAQNGKNIGMQDEYGSMGLGHPHDKWELIGLSNGSFLLKNAVRGNYMQWADNYGNFSTYGSDTPNDDQTFYLNIYVVG